MFNRKHNEGKHAFRKWKWLPVVCALALTLTITVGGTLAWLVANTDSVTNTFKMGQVTPEVTEDFDGTVKENVCVQNKGDVPAYIRVALVATWEKKAEDGTTDVKPASLSDLNITLGDMENDWLEGSDGYYYHRAPVNGGDFTSYLITKAEVDGTNEPAGYHMNLQVIADSIQAAPAEAVTTTWGVTLDNAGNINGLTNAG